MVVPLIPNNEQKRLAKLRSYGILDTEPEQSFDDITLLASTICQVPISLVSLVDEKRQWFKSKVGLGVSETHRDLAFCGHAIHQARLMVVPDTHDDPRFSDSPLVRSDPMIRFYAGAPIVTKDELALGTVCVIDRKPRDLTPEQARALEALARQLGVLLESRLKVLELKKALTTVQLLIDSSIDMIIAMDTGQRITEFNKAAERTFGYSAKEMLGTPVTRLFARPHQSILIHSAIQTQGKIVREVLAKKKNGEVFPGLLSASMLADAQGNTLGVMGILRDLTETKQIEKEKSNFISTVNHELRTPLTSITASLGLISEGIVGDVSTDAKELIDIAYGSCDRLVRLINDMLDSERIESGNMRFAIKAVDPELLTHQAIAAIHGYAVTFSVRFNVVNTCEGATVLADADRVTQVLVNLLSNAVKFSPPESEVTVAIALQGKKIRFSITDCGPGIPSEHHSRLFKKFAQVESPETRRREGSGLGLSISKAIVQAMHGRIWFESVLDQGTTFYFELPMSTVHESVSA